MRIVVNDIAASSGGAMTILVDFYKYVKEYDKDNEWIFLLSGPYLEETEHIQIRLFPKLKQSRLKKLWFDLFTGRKIISMLYPDVVFSMQNIITFGLKARQVVYVHQSIPFQKEKRFSFLNRDERSLAVYQYIIGYIIKASIRHADIVIVQTKWMKDAICLQTKVLPDKVLTVLPNAGDLKSYIHEQGFSSHEFFYPTTAAIYKNNNCIINACKLLEQRGYKNISVKLTLQSDMSNNAIIYTGVLSREQVLEEYNHSTLIFPSYIESFGLPLAEARQMGTLILASDCSFSREILYGYENAYFFDPFQPQALADLMEQVVRREITLRPTMRLPPKVSGWANIISAIEAIS